MLRTTAGAAGIAFLTAVAMLTAQQSSVSTARPRSAVLRTITTAGGRLDWSSARNLLAFDRKGRDGFFDIYTMRPDGSDIHCLTCDRPELPNKHAGNPDWHPSGEYIAFQAQNTYRGLPRLTDFFANPGAGVNNDLWIMDAEGSRFWKITNVPNRIGGVLHPQFSARGNLLLWSERYEARGGRYGLWRLRLADFSIQDGEPSVRNIRSLRPGRVPRFFESHGISPDNRKLLFSADADGQDELALDIYTYDIESGELKNLTSTPNEWDEHAHFSPDGRRIVWMSSRGLPQATNPGNVKSDYWIMNADGSNQRRLTYFNDPEHTEYIPGGAVAADCSWSPDGRQIAGYVITDPKTVVGRIVLMDVP